MNKEIFNEKIFELGEYLDKKQKKDVYKIVKIYCDGQYDLKSSSGNSIVIVPTDKPIVVKVYLSHVIFNKVYSNYQLGVFDSFVFVNVFSACPKLQSVVMEKVIPVVSDTCLQTIYDTGTSNIRNEKSIKEMKKIKSDCEKNVDQLKKMKLVHNDFTLDNVGYSKHRDAYVLFDIDSCADQTSNNIYRDEQSLSSSIDFHNVNII